MDVPRLLQLLAVLYPPPTTPPYLFPSQQHQADAQRELFDGLASPSAWALATQVLDACGVEVWAEDTNARFMAAHMLAVKTSRDWATLPEEHHQQLRGRLLYWLATSARRAHPPAGQPEAPGEKVVLRKLAVATVALSLRLVPSPPGTWPNWLLEVISSVAAPPAPGRLAVLEILTVIAEEAERADLVGSRRVQYDQSLQEASDVITTTLSDAMSPQETPRVKAAALRCSQAWLSSAHLNIEAPTKLWPFLLATLTDIRGGQEEVVQRAADCIEELVSASGSSVGFVTRARADALLDWFAEPQLGGLIDSAIANQEVSDVFLSLVKLFVSLFEHSVGNLAASLTSSRTLALLQRLLHITTFPGYHGVDEQISALPLPLWTLLQEGIADSGALGEEAGAMGQVDAGKIAIDVFGAVAEGLRRKAQWPTEPECSPDNGWTSDVVKSFRVARFDVGEALLSCYYVLREDLLDKWIGSVPQLLSKPQPSGACFEDLEALLHCIRVVHEAVPPEESQHLPRLFDPTVLGSLPVGQSKPFLRLRHTALGIVADYAGWIKSRQTELLSALDFVVPFLSSPDVDTVAGAANALKRLCNEGRQILVRHIAPLAHIIRSTEGKLPIEEYQKVLQSVVSVLQALPAAEQSAPVCSLIEPVVSGLEQTLHEYALQRTEEIRSRMLGQLALLKACNKGLLEPEEDIIVLDGPETPSDERSKANQLNSQPSIQSLRQRLSSTMSSAVHHSGSDSDVAIAVADVLRGCTTSELPTALSLDPFPVLLSTVNAASEPNAGIAIWFSLATSLVVATHRARNGELDESERQALIGAVRQYVAIATSTLNTEEALKQEPDTMQAFLHLCVAITHQFVFVFDILRSELETIVIIATRALAIEERVALQAALGLLSLFIQQTRPQAANPDLFRQLVSVHGPTIIQRVVAGIGGALPRSSIPPLAEVLHSAVLRLPDQTRAWLRQLFDQPGFPSDKVSPERKSRFITSICAARTLKKARDVCTELATVARGLEGSAYGATTLTLTL